MANKIKSLAAQVQAMAVRWPEFTPAVGLSSTTIVWYGNLRGLDRAFRVSVEYGLPLVGSKSLHRVIPVVRVLAPRLIFNFKAKDEAPLPHVYFEGPNYELSPLCLFDPEAGEWNTSMFIADTTVPWAARWLAFYEIWEATGRWYGGGRHNDSTVAPDAA